MPLPTSGQISMGDIRSELGTIASNFSLSGAESGLYAVINQGSTFRPNGSAPNAISEWYGYNHAVATTTTTTIAPSSCTCWTFEGYGRSGAEFIYTPCGGSEIAIGVFGGQSINVCVEDNTPITVMGDGDKFLSFESCCEGGGGGGLTPIYLDYSAEDSCVRDSGQTYYIDATTFTGASQIFLDINGNEIAPDGYYGDPTCCYRAWFGGFLDFAYLC
jgi:hypothetical protein